MPNAPVRGLLFAFDLARDHVLLTPIGHIGGMTEGSFDTFLDLIHADDAHQIRAAFHQVGSTPLHLTCRMRAFGPDHTPVTLTAHRALADAGPHLISGAILEQTPRDTSLDPFIQAANASPNTIFLLDFDTNLHFWSNAFQHKYGHPPLSGPDVVAQWFDLVHPDDKDRVQRSHSTARGGGSDAWQDEYRLRRADGSYATVIDRAHFFRRPDGTIARSISSLEDVTELRDREADIRLTTEASQDVSYSWDVAQNKLSFSPDLQTQYGFAPAHFVPDPSRRFQMIHPDDRPNVQAQLTRILTGPALQLELRYRIVTRWGQVIRIVDRARLLRDRHGYLKRVTGSLVDETRLHAEEQRLRAVVEVAANVIYELDPRTGNITYSEGMHATFGHDWLGQMQAGTVWSNLLHDEERDRIVRDFHAFVAGTDRYARLNYRFRRGDGSWANVRERMIALRDDQGRAIRVVGGMEDVTTELINEERLRQSDKLEAIGKLTGGVAHDFNNLLTVIIGNSGLLEHDAALSPDRQGIARTIGAAARRGAELISSLLAFARRQPLAPKPLDTGSIILELGDLLKRTLPANISLQTSTPKGLWVVEADPAQLNAALLNLAVNAADAMPNGGKILLECRNAVLDQAYVATMPELGTGDYLRIDLTDNGSGMPSDVAAQAFDPFFTTKPMGRGSGLGLSMVWGFAKQSGGHAKIYSEPHHGTKVTLYLPRSKLSPPEITAASPPQAVPKGAQQHILVVEDDAMLRRFVVAMTERLNYKVDQAEDGEQALQILRANPGIALLFTDVVMPGSMNGKELATQALAEFPELVVLFTSGYTENSIIHHGRLDEGVQFLAKPYQLADLARKLASMFDRTP